MSSRWLQERNFSMSTDTALIVIDVQVGMFSAFDPVYQGDALLTRIGYLLGKARQAQIPGFEHGRNQKSE